MLNSGAFVRPPKREMGTIGPNGVPKRYERIITELMSRSRAKRAIVENMTQGDSRWRSHPSKSFFLLVSGDRLSVGDKAIILNILDDGHGDWWKSSGEVENAGVSLAKKKEWGSGGISIPIGLIAAYICKQSACLGINPIRLLYSVGFLPFTPRLFLSIHKPCLEIDSLSICLHSEFQ